MSNKIILKPVDMTPSVMEDLERRNLIIRLCPGNHEAAIKSGETVDTVIYSSHERYGPHKLIGVTVNRSMLEEFGTHPDNEEFLLIGNPDSKPLFLVISLHRRKQLCEKIQQKRLTSNDFVCLRVKYNDADVSFFTMLTDVPHGEFTIGTEGRAPSFYVTESRDLDTDILDMGEYHIFIDY